MKKIIRSCLTFIVLFTLEGCREEKTPQELETTLNQQEVDHALPAYGINISDVLEYTEGVQRAYQLEAWVPSPGNPVLSFDNMPAGMMFDEDKSQLIWSPDYNAANDPTNPSVVSKHYIVNIGLSSDNNQLLSPLRKKIIVLVHDNPQKFTLASYSNTYQLREGKEFEQNVKIICTDLPDGPFIFQAEGIPQDAVILPGRTPSEYIIRWTPWYHEAYGGGTKSYKIRFKVTNLRGYTFESPEMEWKIKDSKEVSSLMYDQIPQVSTVQFFVTTEEAI